MVTGVVFPDFDVVPPLRPKRSCKNPQYDHSFRNPPGERLCDVRLCDVTTLLALRMLRL